MSRRPRFDVHERSARIPSLTVPDLPIAEHREEIVGALRDHQVVVIAGATGSGKTTQLPKLCLEAGHGRTGVIGHTQPRRIAARAVAERLAEELDSSLGDGSGRVGYKVRFTDVGGKDPLIKVMTDGILLAEIEGDPLLRRYSTLIIDEAHERSLTIDFLLGYLLRILPRRPDLTVVVMSATIDPGRFAAHFAPVAGDVPVIEVSGRTFPVEIRYRPPADDVDQPQAVCDALAELADEPPGDVLVFLSGEREIRDTAEAVRDLVGRDRRFRGTEVVPLYGRLSAAEQHRVFEPHRAPRIVLATNVAETSLTVPGIRYVVDPGTARISRYSNRLKVQRLPIEPISQASADQRAGRCGRLSAGVCIRLYAEDEFNARPAFTDPEIHRTHLASVLLRMASLDLGPIEGFGFLDPPDPRAVKDGVALLHELGALDGAANPSAGTRLTDVGRTIARIPVDPRLARMLVAADASGVLDDTLVVVAALSIQDPRETPGERGSAENQKARALHARFDDERSDFVALLNLWEHIHQAQKRLSSSAFRRLCRDENLHYLRIREWQDLVGQLRGIGRDLGLRTGHTAPPADRRYELLHRALLTGLLAHVGLRTQDRKDHLGARGSRFAVSPGSGLFAKPPTWVMAGELVETTRLWGRYCARIEPEWIEPAADHLVVRTLSEPRWSRSRGSAVATERVTLYGIPIVTGRTVTLGRRDPATARELLLRHGLVLGEWRVPGRSPLYAFQRTNQRRLEELSTLEDRVRRRGIVIDEDALLDLYDQRVPADIVSQRHFENWWRTARRSTPDLLTFADEELLRNPEAAGDDAPPLVWTSGGFEGEVTYRFDPTADDDGATVVVPLDALHAVDPAELVSMTNRTREELIAALIRSLPKPLRRHFVPAPDVARELMTTLPEGEPLEPALARALSRRSGLRVQVDDFDRTRIPAHLLPTISVVDDDGQELARSKDVDDLRSRLAASSRRRLTEAAGGLARTGLTGWPDLDVIPRTVNSGDASSPLTGYPCLVDAGEVVDLRVVESAAAQERLHHDGVLRLLLLALGRPHRGIVAGLDARTKLLLAAARYPDMPTLFDEAIEVAVTHLLNERSLPWDRQSFDGLMEQVRPLVVPTAQDIVRSAAAALEAAQEVRRMLDATAPAPAFRDAWTDLDQQWHRFMPDRIITAIGWPMLSDLPRYFVAMKERWERITARRDRDLADLLMVQDLQERWCRAAGVDGFGAAAAPRATAVRWRIEELRVSVFAARQKARGPVSEKRILTDLAALDDGQA